MELVTKPLLSRDKLFYQAAVRLADLGEHRVRVGALAVVNTRVIAGAFNTYRNPVGNVPYREATNHAEMNVLMLTPASHLTKITVYIARISQAGNAMPSKPCPTCAEQLYLNMVKTVVFLNEKGELVRAKLI